MPAMEIPEHWTPSCYSKSQYSMRAPVMVIVLANIIHVSALVTNQKHPNSGSRS